MDFANVIDKWNIPKAVEQLKLKDQAFKLICVDGTEYFLKVREDISKIYTEEELLIFLRDNDIPVAVPLRTKDDSLYIDSDSESYCMYEFINGEHLMCESYEDYIKAAKIYGYILGKLHKVLNKYHGKIDDIKDLDLHKQIFNWAIPQITDQLNDSEVNGILEDLSNELKNIFDVLPKQCIHRDFHGENILFKDNKWIGLIDFDLCVNGFKVFDIGYIMTSILTSKFSNEEYKKNWLTLIPIIINSYIKENDLMDIEKQALWYIFISIQLIFVAYYIGVENKKLAKQNLEIFYWLYNNKEIINRLIMS